MCHPVRFQRSRAQKPKAANTSRLPPICSTATPGSPRSSATIGRSSKRDELGFARHEFLGQFGIGLLSCFVVADRIEVITRAEGAPTVCWVGHADGRYDVSLAATQREEQGTTVILHPRRDAEHWLAGDMVRDLVRLYGELLPVPIRVGTDESITHEPPWLLPTRSGSGSVVA